MASSLKSPKGDYSYYAEGDDVMDVVYVENDDLVLEPQKEDPISSSEGIGSTKWNGIKVDPNAWQTMFFNPKIYKYKLAFLTDDPKLEADLGFTGREDLNQDETRPAIKINPISSILTKGIRHTSAAADIVEQCPSWIPHIKSDKNSKDVARTIEYNGKDAWFINRNYYYLHRLFDAYCDFETMEQLMPQTRSGYIWTSRMDLKVLQNGKRVPMLKLESMELEHFFECRFAGPMLSALTALYPNDATLDDALILLDRIVNNPNNLVWSPASLNATKTSYFGGTSFSNNDRFQGLVRYLDQCTYRFRGLIRRLSEKCLKVYPGNTLILAMLKVLWDSPFCKGYWGTLPPNSVKKLQWTAYNSTRVMDFNPFARSGSDVRAKGWGYVPASILAVPEPNPDDDDRGLVVVKNSSGILVKKEIVKTEPVEVTPIPQQPAKMEVPIPQQPVKMEVTPTQTLASTQTSAPPQTSAQPPSSGKKRVNEENLGWTDGMIFSTSGKTNVKKGRPTDSDEEE